MTELCWQGATDLARAIAGRVVSPVEVVEAHLKRIDLLDGRLRAYLAVFADQALEAARRAEAAVMAGGPPRGPPRGPGRGRDPLSLVGPPPTGGAAVLPPPPGD